MVKGLEEPGPDSDPVFDGVHEWMTQKALRHLSRVVPGERLDLVDHIVRDRCFPPKETWGALIALEDQGWLEPTGTGFRVMKLWEQSERKFFEKLYANACAPPPQRDTLSGAKPTGCRAVKSETSAASRATPQDPPSAARPLEGMEGSVPSYGPDPKYPSSLRVQLARIFFPDLCRQHNIMILPGQYDWRPLARALRGWEQDFGINLLMVRQMMEEFVRHPEWCQNKTFPWKVFLARRDKLMDLVSTQRRRDPARFSKGQDRSFWLNRSKQDSHTSGAEYWLNRL